MGSDTADLTSLHRAAAAPDDSAAGDSGSIEQETAGRVDRRVGGAGGGRPCLPTEQRRRHRLYLTVSDETKARVLDGAARDGERPTTWAARDLVRRLAAHELAPQVGDAELEALRRCTKELNTLVHRLHVERHQSPAPLRMGVRVDEVATTIAALHASIGEAAASLWSAS